ncbi:MAG: dTDP-4-dehydrorhamnose reductase [Pseudomonadota bacterium]
MKLALFGSRGQVATEVQRRLPEGVTLEVIGRNRADFAHPETVRDVARALEVDAVINAAAYTAVDKAEDEPELATTINGTSVGALAEACAETGAALVHISTDYVFSGVGTEPWSPKDATDPQGMYGKSKLAGEIELAKYAGAFATLRTSWVFSAHGNNFVKTMLKFGAERPELKVVNDQIGGPTAAADIADACLTLAAALTDGQAGGIYHFSGAPDVSWADFARAIFEQSELNPAIVDIPSSAWPTKTPRPLNSRLDCSSLEADFGIKRPEWRAALAHVLEELGQKSA